MKSMLQNCFSVASAEACHVDPDFVDFVELAMYVADGRSDATERLATKFRIDSDKLWKYISVNRLKNLFATAPDTAALLPKPVPERLERHLEQQRVTQQQYISELTTLTGALERAKIPVLALKGPSLGQRLFGDPIRRFFCDLDALVDRSQLQEAIALLEAMGYVLAGGRRQVSNHRLRTNHAVELRRRPIRIDLHWHLRNVPYYRVDMSKVWSEHTTIQLDRKPVCVTSDEHTLLLLSLAVVDDLSRGKLRIKHMLDLHLIVGTLGADWNWKEFLAARACDNTLSVCLNAMAVLEGISPPGSLPSTLRDEMQAHEDLIVTRDPAECRQLLIQTRKSFLSWLWISQVYPSASWRDLANLWKLQLPHVGSAPRALWRCSLRSFQTMRFMANYQRLASLWHGRRADPRRENEFGRSQPT